MPPKTVSVTGYKDSGKTSVVEALVHELTSRGYRVGTLKHTADDIILDTPGKDTRRHRDAGSIATGILQENTTALFIYEKISLQQAAAKLGAIEYLIIEGFKTVNTHTRIIVPRENNELKELSNGLEIAIVRITESKFNLESVVPLFNLNEAEKIADIVESKSFPMLPGLDCKQCDYPDCLTMGKAILAGQATIDHCIGFNSSFLLKVNDIDITLNQFTKRALENIILGFIKTLKGGEEAKKVRLEFEQ